MLPDPIPSLKEQLRREILRVVERVTICEGADLLDVDVSTISRLTHADTTRFSLEKLIRILATVDRQIELRVVDRSTMDLWRMRYERRRKEKER
jgi:predicted XRE-type DNA-binding protein